MIELSETKSLRPWLDAKSVANIFLVRDPIAFKASGAERSCAFLFDRFHVVQFPVTEPNPKFESVVRGVTEFKRGSFDAMIAIGGGTTIDVAKLIRCFSQHTQSPCALVADTTLIAAPNQLPLVAVPTTSGTGSEVTHFAVLYIDQLKHSIAHHTLLPDVALLDASLTLSMPTSLAAVTGLDALCQAIESMWSIHSTEESLAFASESLSLSMRHLFEAVHHPTIANRGAMLRAANLAGKAINITKTTGPHALSYALTIEHGVPHGHAVALTLPTFLQFNAAVTAANVADRRGAEYVRSTLATIIEKLDCRSAGEAALAVQRLVTSLGCATRLSQLQISGADVDQISRSVNLQRLSNNPRTVSAQDLRDILDSIR